MKRLNSGWNGVRSNALWGSSGGRDTRTNALWGKGGRGSVVVLAFVCAMALPMAATGKDGNGNSGKAASAFVSPGLLDSAQANPDKLFRVVVLGAKGKKGSDVGNAVQSVASSGRGKGKGLSKAFKHVPAASAELTGSQILALADKPKDVKSITLDSAVRPADLGGTLGQVTAPVASTTESVVAATSDAVAPVTAEASEPVASEPVASEPAATQTVTQAVQYVTPPHSSDSWRDSTRISELWADAPQAPAIAIVDSGIDASLKGVFGDRIVASVSMIPGVESANDGQGHGTMVAAVAAGNDPAHPGAARNAPIVNLRVADDNGLSVVSDVIAAADWILANKDTYNIRVANFSLRGTVKTTIRFDPLNAALRRLWWNGVVVVAAAGNHGEGQAVDMSYAPGNDPFVISVGASDEQDNADPLDNTVTSWSGYGHTMDGFHKPDMVAPGRYMVMPVPAGSTLQKQFPERQVAPGYMWMSGTSFAAPIVAGAAAQILARYPHYTADQVKGALMLTSNYLGGPGVAAGVGQIDAAFAASFEIPVELNPNENFYSYTAPDGSYHEFVKTDPETGQRYLDEASWSSHIQTDASWSSASWSSASWSSASWSSSNFGAASWSSASWSSAVSAAMESAATGLESSSKE